MRWKYWLPAVVTVVAFIWLAAVWLPDEPEDVIPSGTLGMVLIDIADDEAADFYHVEEHGVYVLAVEQASQAYRAGIRSGDRLLDVNGCPLSSTMAFAAVQEGFQPQQPISLSFFRRSEVKPQVVRLIWEEQ